MDFELNEEERLIQKLARDFAENEIRPVAHQYDESEEVPYEIIGKASALGLASAFGGGSGDAQSPLASALIVEQLSWGCAGIALAIASSGLAAAAISATGTNEQKAKFLPMCTSTEGDVRLGVLQPCEDIPNARAQRIHVERGDLDHAKSPRCRSPVVRSGDGKRTAAAAGR